MNLIKSKNYICFKMDIDSGRSSGNIDSGSQRMSGSQKEAHFRKQHKEYIAMKLQRKKEMMRRIRQEFGSSSSEDQSDFPMSPPSPDKTRNSYEKAKKIKVEDLNKPLPTVDLTEKIPILFLANKGKYSAANLQFKQGGIYSFSGQSFQIKAVDKVRVGGQVFEDKNYKVKITHKNGNQVVVGASVLEKKIGLPLHYYVFAKIIQQKIISLGTKLTENTQEKMSNVPEEIMSKAYKYGKILKKSQFRGKWEERIIVIDQKGLYSYKKANQKHTMFIGRLTVSEIFTKFEFESNMLVIKLKYETKTEFGIPLADFLSMNSWLYHFYSLSIKV